MDENIYKEICEDIQNEKQFDDSIYLFYRYLQIMDGRLWEVKSVDVRKKYTRFIFACKLTSTTSVER